MKFICIIPARYGSTRFPGKPLASLAGKPMIEWVYLQAKKAFSDVWIATDDPRISDSVLAFGGNVVMTKETHRSGTDRCAEAIQKIENNDHATFDVIINIQGDEPFIQPGQLNELTRCFEHPETQIASLVKKIKSSEEINNPNLPKVVFNKNLQALYFSRSPIPYIRDTEKHEWTNRHQFFRHIGLYGYRKETLFKLTQLPQSSLEIAESLEQNRWLEHGYQIQLGITEEESIGIDTPDDLQRAESYFKKDSRHG